MVEAGALAPNLSTAMICPWVPTQRCHQDSNQPQLRLFGLPALVEHSLGTPHLVLRRAPSLASRQRGSRCLLLGVLPAPQVQMNLSTRGHEDNFRAPFGIAQDIGTFLGTVSADGLSIEDWEILSREYQYGWTVFTLDSNLPGFFCFVCIARSKGHGVGK